MEAWEREEWRALSDRMTIRVFRLGGHDWRHPRARGAIVPADSGPLRRIAEKIGRQFQREGHFDFPPYLADEPNYGEAVLLTSRRDGVLTAAVGAAGFSYYLIDKEKDTYWPDPAGTPALTWIWVHPYHRGRLLYEAWADLEELYGQFLLEGPFTRPMRGFLRHHEVDPARLIRNFDVRRFT